jgi:lipopolysaccharide export system protein LptC
MIKSPGFPEALIFIFITILNGSVYFFDKKYHEVKNNTELAKLTEELQIENLRSNLNHAKLQSVKLDAKVATEQARIKDERQIMF